MRWFGVSSRWKKRLRRKLFLCAECNYGDRDARP